MSEVKVNKVSPRSGTGLQLGDSGDTITIPSGATLANSGTATGFASIAWQSSIVTAATLTADANKGYWIDTSSNACTVTLPGSASVGDQLYFVDYARNFATNALTINQNSLNYQGNSSPNPVYNTNGQAIAIVYSGATKGWIPTSDDDVTMETPQSIDIEYLIVGGGGCGGIGGGGEGQGGGGAGGYRTNFGGTPLGITQGSTYTVTVGAGGTDDKTLGNAAESGGNSSISGTGITTLTAAGGGGGGANTAGAAGGSGGGGGHNQSGGAGNTPSTSPVQGYAGGNGSSTEGGGGGGSSGVGANSSGGGSGGNGGNGTSNSISGSAVTYAGGGGGAGQSSYSSGGGTGGTGGGGNGGFGSAGANATGVGSGGGGASNGNTGGTGSNGTVIVRMATSDYSGTKTGGTATTSGGDTIITYTSDGSFVA